ncbi:hypothetical protein KUTeg_012240 [Tegillarca granosa]|uniref:Uncharacterized protein n=1 Tax=Tegillarca granosa TaxID=220873 RepID=A0ABQ9F2H3_TEGGR|nr:hypothetical protein KUTeg_012240 [Tegillarca granosa]
MTGKKGLPHVGLIDANGDLTGFREHQITTKPSNVSAVQLVAVPITNSPNKMSPYKVDHPHLLPRSTNQVYLKFEFT